MFFDLTNPDHAYFFGFVQTDGSLYAGKGQKGKLSIELQAHDVDMLKRFQRLLPFNSSIIFRTRDTNFAVGYRSAVWTLSSLTARQELVSLGLIAGRKSTASRPPDGSFSHNDYLRGLIDGDGSVGTTARGYPFVSFTTASDDLAAFFCAEIKRITGAMRSARANARDGVYNLMVMSDPAAELAATLYPEDCLALPRKAAAARSIATWTRPAGMRRRSSPRRWTPEEDDVVLALSTSEAAERLGRTKQSVNLRRWRLRHE
ncbi:LAGLIDADG family homing endonuclease [Actinocatenispora sera]|jgi:hypothetical protein|uniref:Homing endonuclease LAGLIDADG domain-containing protein n=1 Tax=Actinocatenispora sera TaxID=390989 RepID=A0A810L1Q8_9ACTN|nr:LAGLIDADG family homing endonuclease [Actinocatenispora sera]BCJ29343.1 hypothetical protein Asera_34510 [Actinocatenispora sera]